MGQKRDWRIDLLKGIAILAVVAYHFQSILPFGYLGVEIFFVISGFLMMRSILKDVRAGSFSWWKFITSRVARLWPLVLLAALISFALGYFVMLPDDYENLAQHVVASNVFANNILSCITTKNYWDIVNLYKPLMHTWYLGLLMQAYAVAGLVVFAVSKISKNSVKAVGITTIVLTVISAVAYILPTATDAQKFYYLPWRLFEILAGGLIAFIPYRSVDPKGQRWLKIGQGLSIGLMIVLLCINSDFIPAAWKLILMVCLTTFVLYGFQRTEAGQCRLLKPIALIGSASLSVYLSHQIVVAFMFYSVTDEVSLATFLAFAAAVAIFSVLLYCFAERPLGKLTKHKLKPLLLICLALCVVLCGMAGLVYLNAGVVRDVPELGVTMENAYRGMHAQYCDRPYAWNKDFSSTDKVKVLVIGDSFGRDFANILSESDISDSLEISYIFSATGKQPEGKQARIDAADIVFWSNSINSTQIMSDVSLNDKNYVVGYKNFGSSNGIVYARRANADYFSQSVKLDETVIRNNEILKQHYGENFVDMLRVAQNEDGSVKVFTEDGHFISQDCRHLTQQGAIYYAEQMDLSWILSKR